MHRIMIAMPTTGSVKTATLQSVFSTTTMLMAAGHDLSMRTVESSSISRSRNYLASSALEMGATHILFIDSDMTFQARVVQQLLASERPVVGAIYPKRQVDLAQLVQLARRLPDDLPPKAVIAKALEFVVRWPKGAANLQIAPDGLCEVRGVGMGLTLIATGVLRAMIDKGCAALMPKDYSGAAQTWGFFDHLPDESGTQMGEDLSFCERWRVDCGGEVWALATPDIGHIGDLVHQANVLDHYLPPEALLAGLDKAKA